MDKSCHVFLTHSVVNDIKKVIALKQGVYVVV